MQKTAKWQREEWVQNTAGSDMEPIIGCENASGKARYPQVGSEGTVPSGTGVMP
jgi:hypothetical protein